MKQKANDELQPFITTIQESFRTLLWKYRIALCVIFLAVFFTGVLFAVLLESFFYLSSAVKFILFLLLLAISLAAAGFVYSRLNRPSFSEFYHRFSKQARQPAFSDALDLYFSSDTSKSPLYAAAILQNVGKLQLKSIRSDLRSFHKNHSVNASFRYGLIGSLLAVLMLFTVHSYQPAAMSRLLHIWDSYAPPNPYNFTVEPGSLTLEQGQSFSPTITFAGRSPDELTLAFKTDIEDTFRKRYPLSITTGEAAFSAISPTTNARYYFIMDGFESEHYTVNVQLRPRFDLLKIQISPPEYTQLDTTYFSYPFSKIKAYPGSVIELKGVTNKPITQYTLHRSTEKDTTRPLFVSADSTIYNHRWTFTHTDTVSFSMMDPAGLSNKNEFEFILEKVDDQAPFVSLLKPQENIRMRTAQDLMIEYKAGDDFGLTGASLHYKIQQAFTDNVQTGTIALPVPKMNQPYRHNWALEHLKPKPRDVITFWLEVRDNDAFNGTKTGRSRMLTITFPSMTEYLDELGARETNVAESLENISQSFDEMQREYDQFRQQLQQNSHSTWEQTRSLQKVQNQQQKVDQQLEKLNEEFRDLRSEIEKQGVMSPETIKAYKELQQLMKEINNPELAEALQQLQHSLAEMDPQQMREALENYEFNEELYEERIQRTIELFKSLKLNSDLEKIAVTLDKMAEQEQQVIESHAASQNVQRQKVIQKDLRSLQQQLKSLRRNAPEKAADEIQELQEEAQQKLGNINRKLEENIEQLKRSATGQKGSKLQQQQQEIKQKMQQLASRVRNSKQQLNKQQRKINTAGLKYILYTLINLSQNQEQLAMEIEGLPYRSQAFVEKARTEQNISQQFSMLADSLFQLSAELPGFSNQINKKRIVVEAQLQKSVELLAERDRHNSLNLLHQSLGGINALATTIASFLDQLQNQPPGGGGGAMSMQQFIEQLQKMTGQQQELNQQIQRMINDIQGNRLTSNQLDRLNQLAKQQNNIRKQLEELQREGTFNSGDQILSKLERMSEKMERAINDLRGGQLNRELMQRQQNILSRMLAAENAVQERGKEEERKAVSAKDAPSATPPEITYEELQNKIRQMLSNPNYTRFREDYQQLIEQYFKILEQQQSNNE